MNVKCYPVLSKAQEALGELETATKQLQAVRDSLAQAASEQEAIKREVEHAKRGLTDCLALNEIEQRNLSSSRNRIISLKAEISSLEDQAAKSKESIVKEEQKLRTTKSIASDQLRLLQADLKKVQTDYRSQQKAIADLDRHLRSVEEESEVRKRDVENELASVRNQIDDGNIIALFFSDNNIKQSLIILSLVCLVTNIFCSALLYPLCCSPAFGNTAVKTPKKYLCLCHAVQKRLL